MPNRDGRVGDIARSWEAHAGTAFVDAVDPQVLPDGMPQDLRCKRGKEKRFHRYNCWSTEVMGLALFSLHN
jgi:hypothetical protein